MESRMLRFSLPLEVRLTSAKMIHHCHSDSCIRNDCGYVGKVDTSLDSK